MSTQLIANELLAFIQHAIDTMDEVSILQICKSNFTEVDVSSGKKLLYESLGKLDQMPSRRRDGTEKSCKDIVTLLKGTDPDDVPTFVAKDLHKLPPVTFDHVDVTRLLKDITSLKASLAEVQSKLKASDNTICELRAEVVLLRSTISTSRSPDAMNVNTRRGAQIASVCSFELADSNDTSIADRGASCITVDPVAATAVKVAAVGTSTPKRAYAAIAATGKRTQKLKGSKQRWSEPSHKKEKVPKKDTCDEDGFIKVEKKKRKPTYRNQCGTGLACPNMLLRPAVPSTLMYVSRLHHSTKVEEVVEYIRAKTNLCLRVEKLEPRHITNFNSFVVRAPTQQIDTFLKEEFWPRGVVYRRFRGRVQNTTKCNITPK